MESIKPVLFSKDVPIEVVKITGDNVERFTINPGEEGSVFDLKECLNSPENISIEFNFNRPVQKMTISGSTIKIIED